MAQRPSAKKQASSPAVQRSKSGCSIFYLLLPIILVLFPAVFHHSLPPVLVQVGILSPPFTLPHCPTESTAGQKVYVITGANSGLGYASALALSLGSTATDVVVLGCRTVSNCQQAKAEIDAARLAACGAAASSNVFAPAVGLELNKPSTILPWTRSLASSGIHYVSHLMLNAGVMNLPLNPLNSETNQEVQTQVNHFSHFTLTANLLPLLIASPKSLNPTVVTVSSLAAHFPFAYDVSDMNFQLGRAHSPIKAYGQSKRSNLLFASYLADALQPYGIKSTAAHPGYSRTSLVSNGWTGVPQFVKRFMSVNPVGSMSAADGAKMQIRALLDESVPNAGYVVPLFYAVGPPVVSKSKTALLDTALSWVVGKRAGFSKEDVRKLYEKSVEVTKLKIE